MADNENTNKKETKGRLQGMLDVFKDTLLPERKSENEYIRKFSESRKNIITPIHSKYNKKEKLIFAALGITIGNILILLIGYIHAFTTIKPRVITNSPIYLIIATILPYTAWIFATNENYWAFHRRKRRFFAICTVNMSLVIFQLAFTLITKLGRIIVDAIPINPLLTIKMTYLLGQITEALLSACLVWFLYIQFEPLIQSETVKKEIEIFKLQHVRDDRDNREWKYDIKAIRNLETGKSILIKENDRFVQIAINGASGTGKTSTIFEGVIKDDLDQKVKNRGKRQEALLAMVEKKQAYIQGPLREFTENAIMPRGNSKAEKESNQKKIDKIRKKYPDCGMTIVAPNSSMIEDIIRMSAARGITVNVIDPDPLNNYNKYTNVKFLSLNPFYIPLGLKESDLVLRIAEAASVFSDVLIATNQMGGESDVYFTDISLSVSSNISTVIMLAKNIEGKQACIDDVQECINNFENLRPYIDIIENKYGAVKEGTTATKGGKVDAERINDIYVKRNVSPAQKVAAAKNPYYYQLLFVKQELLGAGAEDMFSQARGLRNLINKILENPSIKGKLSAGEEQRIDFDKILANNEITVVNTAISLGEKISTSFGLFFLLTHQVSVLRRPPETRTPHFLWIDECAQYVHPFFDNVVALYRQYRVAAVLTLQTLTQLEKRSATAYLKNVFLGAGTHIVFGRLAPEEMKLYSEMSGINRELTEQKTTQDNSLFTSNPSHSESVRTTPAITAVLEGADMRNLDFLELTIFTINAGRVLPGQLARVFFIGQDAFDEVPFDEIPWKEIAPEAFKQTKEETIDCEKTSPDSKKAPSYEDKAPNDPTVEQILTQGMPKKDRIEEKQPQMSLNELYMSLMVQPTVELPQEEEDIDYAAASREFNRRRKNK